MTQTDLAELRTALIETALCVCGSEPQRRAFLAGYNGHDRPSPSSDAMRKFYRSGQNAYRFTEMLRARSTQETNNGK